MSNIDEAEIKDEILNDEIDYGADIEDDELVLEAPLNKYLIKSGDTLETKEIYEISAKEKSKMIVFVGPAGSGKTTIGASLYQLFQKSPVGGFYFAGSSTIQGYEQRSFYTRIKSNVSVPSTLRTSLQLRGPFLHLRLLQKEKNKINNFLFADLSGEAYESHIGKIIETKMDFPFIDRADYIVGVLDGKLLLDMRKRKSTIEGILQLIRTLYDANLVNNECTLQIVFSKYDLLCQEENKIIEKCKQDINNRLSSLFRNIEYYNVAAMPDEVKKFQIGYGIEELLKSWVNNYTYKKKNRNIEKLENLSEFDKLYNKFLGVVE